VQVALQDTGWKLRATVAISNESGTEVFVLPALVTLDELTPSMRNLRQENPAKLARSESNHMLLRDEATAMPPATAVSYHSNSSTPFSSVSHRETPPDYTEAIMDGGVQSLSLKTKNLAPGQKTAGVLWFTRDAGAHELSIRLSVGNLVFDFPFSFEQKK